MLEAANRCQECLAAGTLPEVCRSCIVGADVVASTASGTRAASSSGRPSPPRELLKNLLLRLQCQMPSPRFGCAEQPHNQEKAGDVLESVGGFLSSLNKRAAVSALSIVLVIASSIAAIVSAPYQHGLCRCSLAETSILTSS